MATATARPRSMVRSVIVPAASALVVLGLAIAAALASRSPAGEIGVGESLSSSASTFLSGLGTGARLGFAFAAGMVASVNPCGFALFPAYIALYLGTERARHDLPSRLLRAAGIGGVVTLSFVALFAAVGLLVVASAAGVARIFPIIGLLIGFLLVVAGAVMLGGGALQLGFVDRIADRFGAVSRRRGVAGYVAFGVAYAAGSLGCTLPIFLTVVATGFTAGGPLGAVAQLGLYGLGMGVVLIAVTVASAVIEHAALRRVRRIGAALQPAGAVVLLLAGGYVVYYWLAAGALLAAMT